MPTELEELVEFLHHGNTQIRQIGYSTAQPSLFKRNQLEPVRDLKLLIKDYASIARNALTILVNITEDKEVLESLARDDAFLESLLRRVTDKKDPNVNEQCMLLANLGKSNSITRLLTLQRDVPKLLSTSPIAIDQLLDCFVKGVDGSYNEKADYDYLSYLFADIAKHEDGRKHFLNPRKEDQDIVPLTKLVVFTEHKSTIRRRGVANTIKNASFDIFAHLKLLTDQIDHGVGMLPYILLPLMGSEEYSDEETEGMLDEVQLLDPDKEREKQPDIICTHLETLLLLTTSPEGRKKLRDIKLYPIIRELHQHTENEDVREGCDRLVQVLMRGEPGDKEEDVHGKPVEPRVQEIDDEDDQIVDVA
ncbi:hypothetical protein Tdes44962_MAKER03431 [Teratosphaeria destructans]|uniref:Protein HGH1 homolog n=1 Tax=Teratosphaeria destructans TaxID=418781 RepID=A0A9W7SQF8_9PEZI|nr:hypothetical protein Tdes44962_MAKER03431 [Teratosphaeria destructans]